MREITVAAIQPHMIGMEKQYNVFSEGYRNEPLEIVERYVEKQICVTTALLERAGEAGCSIVTTSEDICGLGDYQYDLSDKNIFPELVRQSCPLAENALAHVAAKYGMYVVGCYYKLLDGKIWNVASLFDRAGNILGEHRKVHLPACERWQCAEGDAFEAFETDFGRVGMCICYDMMFQESVEMLSLKGAEIVFHPTYGYGWYDDIGEATLRVRANDNGVYIVTAKNYQFNRAGKSSIIDHWGQVLADAGFAENALVMKTIDLDVRKTQPDWHMGTAMSGVADVKLRMLKERRPEVYGAIAEDLHGRLRILECEEQKQLFEGIKKGEYGW